MADCPHGLTIGTCAMCGGDNLDDEPKVGARTTAKFESRCVLCDDPMLEGDRIRLTENGWAHEECD